ncbi:MAG: aminopeptidase [Clostridia bacterium]|nr:aminopeptidase [Clostridia bacterium]
MITKIKTIINGSIQDENTHKYVAKLGENLLEYFALEEILTEAYFKSKSFEELKALNYKMYAELISDAYQTSYANPDYCVNIFGKDLGQLLSAIYTDFRKIIRFAFKHDKEALESYAEGFLRFAAIIKNEASPFADLKVAYYQFKLSVIDHYGKGLLESRSPKHAFANKAISHQNFEDLRYLFTYGDYITDNEIKTAEFLKAYDEQELLELMEMTASAYVRGFETDGKDITLRHNVTIYYNIGQEKMIEVLIQSFKKRNLNGFYGQAIGTSANRQYGYDHRFDNALYLDEAFKEAMIIATNKVSEEHKEVLLDYSGIMYFEKFGETPFEPKAKENALKLSETQSTLAMELQNTIRTTTEKYLKGTETSFCIIAFPVPEIGEEFEAIYADTCQINKLSSDTYLPIQQIIIDALDQSDFVHVRGKGLNRTDIMVKQYEMRNPEKETNYFNCGADVNIPIGEVFTSPKLEGTNGLLHLDVVYLNDLKFIDLELTFKDGYISEYTCKNFENEEDNKKFVQENLLFPHKTLPLGEFAIGTNTLAYVIAEKYNIVDILPILIVEKMGPHFAIGDTCYTYTEDLNVYNPNGKCIVAKDNEHSLTRKTDVTKAYTNVHTDITLPYDSILSINGIKKDQSIIPIIKDGRFVLPGTELLNEPFMK